MSGNIDANLAATEEVQQDPETQEKVSEERPTDSNAQEEEVPEDQGEKDPENDQSVSDEEACDPGDSSQEIAEQIEGSEDVDNQKESVEPEDGKVSTNYEGDTTARIEDSTKQNGAPILADSPVSDYNAKSEISDALADDGQDGPLENQKMDAADENHKVDVEKGQNPDLEVAVTNQSQSLPSLKNTTLPSYEQALSSPVNKPAASEGRPPTTTGKPLPPNRLRPLSSVPAGAVNPAPPAPPNARRLSQMRRAPLSAKKKKKKMSPKKKAKGCCCGLAAFFLLERILRIVLGSLITTGKLSCPFYKPAYELISFGALHILLLLLVFCTNPKPNWGGLVVIIFFALSLFAGGLYDMIRLCGNTKPDISSEEEFMSCQAYQIRFNRTCAQLFFSPTNVTIASETLIQNPDYCDRHLYNYLQVTRSIFNPLFWILCLVGLVVLIAFILACRFLFLKLKAKAKNCCSKKTVGQ